MKKRILKSKIALLKALAIPVIIIFIKWNGFSQAPGGVSTGLTAWFKPEIGVNITAGNITSWNNQATNPNLLQVTPNGGASSLTNNDPISFNFNPYIQFNNGSLTKEVSTNVNEIFETNAGSAIGVGTAADQLITNTSNFTTNPCGANRCCTGTRATTSQFGNTNVDWSTSGSINTDRANIWGLRASTSGTPQQENTFNGFKNTGNCGSRSNGTYRFGIGSFVGYFYGSGKISEVVCYNRQITSTEFIAVESYLAIKYGITLGNSLAPKIYTASNNNIIWEADTNFQYNVIGIGRDDASALMQKQSKSVHIGSKITIYNDDVTANIPNMNTDNSTNISTDLSFIMVGNNHKDTSLSKCMLDGRAMGMNRTWKMLKTGDINFVTILFESNAFDPTVNCIIVSTDTLFNSTNSSYYPIRSNGTQKFAVIPTNNSYFTFSTFVELNAVVQNSCSDGTNGSISLSTSGGINPISYTWNTNPPQYNQSINNLNSGTYTVTVNHGGACTFTEEFTIQEAAPININITSIQNSICAPNSGSISIEASGGTPTYVYRINNGNWSTSGNFSNLASGTHLITVMDKNNCTKDTLINLTHSQYTLSVNIKTEKAWCIYDGLGGSVTAKVENGTLPYQYSWSAFPNETTNQVKNIAAGVYQVIVSDKYGCTGTSTAEVAEVPCCNVYMPNVFTPNDDGINDKFMPVSNVIIPHYYLEIYNRYGQKVFHTTRSDEGWNGTFGNDGIPVDVGTYFYMLIYTCERSDKEVKLSGDVTLLR